MQILQHDGIELAHRQFGAIVALHQVFAGASVQGRFNAHLTGQCRLKVEQQAVFATAGQIMQSGAQGLQQRIVACNLARFGFADESGFSQFRPACAEPCRAAYPCHRLQVAQAARTLLEIGFQIEVGIVKARVAQFLLMQLGGKKC